MSNGGMLNPKHEKTTQNNMFFGLIFLTYWLDGKFENLLNLYKIYTIYSEPTKKIICT